MFLILFCFFSFSSLAQERNPLSYEYSPEYSLRNLKDNQSLTLESHTASLGLPPLYRSQDKSVMLLGRLRYQRTYIDSNSSFLGESKLALDRVSAPISLIYRLSSQKTWMTIFAPSLNTDYKYINDDDRSFFTLSTITDKTSSTFTWSYGFVQIQNLDSIRVFPAIAFNWRFAPAWNFAFRPPGLFLNYQLDRYSKYSLGLRFNGAQWSLGDKDVNDRIFQQTGVLLELSSYQVVYGDIAATVRLGYGFSNKYTVHDQVFNTDEGGELSDFYQVTLGISLIRF